MIATYPIYTPVQHRSRHAPNLCVNGIHLAVTEKCFLSVPGASAFGPRRKLRDRQSIQLSLLEVTDTYSRTSSAYPEDAREVRETFVRHPRPACYGAKSLTKPPSTRGSSASLILIENRVDIGARLHFAFNWLPQRCHFRG